MNLNPTLILVTDWNTGIAFEGKAAADMLALLPKGRVVSQERRDNVYGWWPADPDKVNPPKTELIPRSIQESIDTETLRRSYDTLKERLDKHAAMIEAAEMLESQPASDGP